MTGHAPHPDVAPFLPKIALTRREMLVSSLASGFALAVQPVQATTIKTDDTGLVAGEVKIPVVDGEIPGYRAMPAKRAPRGGFPLVLVVQEVFGVHEHIRDICRRFAKEGYFAVAGEMFARQGDVSKISSIQELLPIVAQVPDAQVMSDLDSIVAWARSTKRANAGKLGITGFCWGGRVTWLYAAHNPTLKAGVAWYGRLVGAALPGGASPLQPKAPVELVAQMRAPVLGLYGGKDTGIPVADVETMRAALQKAGSRSRIELYPDAQHGFFADYRPSYAAAEARDAWGQCLAWFRANGVG